MKVCPKCFESNEESAGFCKDCGAPLKGTAEGSDQEVYSDLAKANLFRTRQDYKSAADVCRGILRRYPNNPTAHTLLGDISVDEGDLEQAKTWYEMALDLVPGSKTDQQKLASIEERIKLRDTAETAKLIGIPEKQTSVFPYLAVMCLVVLVVGAGAFILGQSLSNKAEKNSTIQTPIKVDQPSVVQNTVEPPEAETPVNGKPEEKPVQSNPVTGSPDLALLQALQSKGTEKLEYVSINEDPRGPTAVLTVKGNGEVMSIEATKAGLDFFRVFPAYSKVTIRIMSEAAIAFVADMSRDAAKTAEAALAGGDTIESQSQVMLAQVWTPKDNTNPAPETAKN